MTLAAAIAAYLDGYLRAERHASEHTLRNYATDLRLFATFAGPATPLAEVQARHVRGFLADLHAHGCGKATLARRLSSIRSLFRFCTRQELLQDNPARRIAAPKLPRPLPPIPTTGQVNELLDQSPTTAVGFPERDYALLELLYGSGLRVGELTALNLPDVSFELALVRVTGKGRRQRQVPFGGKAAAALRRYLPLRQQLLAALPKRPAPNAAAALFLNRRGGRLTARSVARIVKTAARAFGLPLDLHPHSLRHAFASHLLGEGADLRAIQEMLGHRRLSTTQRYTRTDIRQIAAVYDRAHPLEAHDGPDRPAPSSRRRGTIPKEAD